VISFMLHPNGKSPGTFSDFPNRPQSGHSDWCRECQECQELNSGCPACSQLLSSFITVQINKQTNKQTSKQITGIKELTP